MNKGTCYMRELKELFAQFNLLCTNQGEVGVSLAHSSLRSLSRSCIEGVCPNPSQTRLVQGSPRANIFKRHIVSVTTIQLCHYSMKVAIDDT